MALHRKARRGAQAIEFALVLPVLLAITAGIIDYSWFYSQHLSILHDVREGMRSAASQDSDNVDYLTDGSAFISARLETHGYTSTEYAITPSFVLSDDVCLVDFVVTVGPYEPLWGLVPTPSQHSVHEMIRAEDQDACP